MWALGFIAVAVYVSTIGSSYFTRQSERDKRAARREATLDERERIARDVHDVLGHTLTVISLKSELANKLLDRDVERARAEIADIHQLSRQAIAEVRSTVSGLAGRQLAAELTHIEEVADDAGIALTITGSADDADPSHRILFGWVVREAMTNIVRHSGARHAWIKIGAQRIVVADDGVGFSPMSEGNGLRGLRQRVENAGGRLKVTSPGPGGRGAQIEVEL
nr:sensor histidine kinase [Trueperella bernardiae]